MTIPQKAATIKALKGAREIARTNSNRAWSHNEHMDQAKFDKEFDLYNSALFAFTNGQQGVK